MAQRSDSGSAPLPDLEAGGYSPYTAGPGGKSGGVQAECGKNGKKGGKSSKKKGAKDRGSGKNHNSSPAATENTRLIGGATTRPSGSKERAPSAFSAGRYDGADPAIEDHSPGKVRRSTGGGSSKASEKVEFENERHVPADPLE